MTNPSTTRAGRKEWTAFAVLLLPLLLVSMDTSVLFFAVPAITRDLGASSTQQLWIFDSYAFALAGLLMTMGSLGDRIGRRRLLLLGAAAFGTASVAAAYAQSAEMLIAARFVLGIGGATLMPSTMGLVRNMFRDDAQRAKAVGIWSAAMAGGIALGSVLGGVMLKHFWWGSVFLLNVPAMVLLLVCAPLLVPEFKDPRPGRFDLASVVLSMGAVLPTIYGVKEMAADGFAVSRLLWVLAGLALGVAFVRRQRGGRSAMISRELFRHRAFGAGIGLNTLAMFAMMGSSYFTTQYLQSVLGKGPLEAALWGTLPSLAVGAAGPLATVAAQRVDRAYVIATGFVITAAGFALLLGTDASSLTLTLISCAVIACGIVTVAALVSDLALGATPPEKAGSAAALLETGQEFGGALGMAVFGTIGMAVYRHDVSDGLSPTLPHGELATVRETLTGATAVAGRLPGRSGAVVLSVARDGFVHGMHVAAVGAALVLLTGAAVSVRLLRGRAEAPSEALSQAPSEAPVAAGR
ncbi:MFS transporter [Streptomyces mobaraensis NBRC 13819 = DSM 40847]|uniref:Transmembrane efflux protein n=1 Tax=Streptomyces mobaraensis (strain ATCC 29032 / DSM 40847 / JCM 4168 / NBRC 13819 / NCIMB 11159 / IPCR 16-22) TaxID=1223523 RepID=M3BGM9_STRM1|nr:MFS transporter [Streptomyces mobaraensis]EME98744.1 transmembrane efflux protein [Streptomyces mobaraensis NBRC 13819 = DSM 40847]QTT75876.1 MFS transporter [Streptomyces mobaraensis NBRC 13819 = DSM 40847]